MPHFVISFCSDVSLTQNLKYSTNGFSSVFLLNVNALVWSSNRALSSTRLEEKLDYIDMYKLDR